MFQLISDGGCDFTKDEAQQYNVEIVPFYITFDQKTYLKEGIDISKEAFFKRLSEDKNLFPKTAQPSPQDYIDACKPSLDSGKDVIILTISSKNSGSYNSAVLANQMLQEEYPDRTIVIIDSLNGSIGQGLILKEMIKMRDVGYSITEIATVTAQIIKTTKIYFTLDTIEYLRKGGRVGPTTAFVGGILGLRPVLHLINGTVEQFDSVRGKKRVLQLIEKGVVAALQGEMDSVSLVVGHTLRKEDIWLLKTNLETALDTKIGAPIEVGATTGTHIGPGAVAVAYCSKFETFSNGRSASA